MSRDPTLPGEVGRLETAPLKTVPVRPGGDPAAASASTGSGAIEHDEQPDALVGRVLAGRYEILRVLGHGGMGIVYEARHVALGQSLALKVLRRDLARSSEAVGRFQREAKAAAAIRSPNIVDVFDFGFTDDGHAFIAMELLHGEDLRKLLRRESPLEEARVRRLGAEIARALAVAHDRGIIHRDLKSENVFILRRGDDEHIKLLDFGISKVTDTAPGEAHVTVDGAVLGTPHYMAPEQVSSGSSVDHRIDVYALGCMLFEMATGELPFTGATPVEVVYKQVHEAPRSPRSLRPTLSKAFDRVVLRSLEKDREKRFTSAAEFARALEALADDEADLSSRDTGQAPSATNPPGSTPLRRGRLVALGAVALCATALLLVQAGRPVRHALRAMPRVALPDMASPAASASSSAAVTPREVRMRVVATPPSARVRIDGAEAGVGSATFTRREGERTQIDVEATGYAPMSRTVPARDGAEIEFALTRLANGANASSRPPRENAPSAGEASAPPPLPSATLAPEDGLKTNPYPARHRPGAV